jgi:hypothetical protein
MNIEAVWDSIRINNSSVQHLEVLNDLEKAVFKTFPNQSNGTVDSKFYTDYILTKGFHSIQ